MINTEFTTIRFSITENVALIVLNRPDKLNSFTAQMHDELKQAFEILNHHVNLRGVILTGEGRGFCAGQDLTERKKLPEGHVHDLGDSLKKRYGPLIQTIRELSVPVIAVVNGVAAGAGMSLALACDLVYAVKSAKFIQAFSKVGLIPDAGGTLFLPQLLGTQRAMGLAFFAQPVSATQAEEWGLIWKCIEDDKVTETIEELHQFLFNAPTKALAATKQAIYASSSNTLNEQLALEAMLQRQMGMTKDYREGVSAFSEKRSPNFSGE